MRFGFIFGAAVMKIAVAWVVLAAACYVARDVYLYPAGLAGWFDPSFWRLVLTPEGITLLLSGIWANPDFAKIALGVAGLLLVWSCFVSAMLARILEIDAENEAERQSVVPPDCKIYSSSYIFDRTDCLRILRCP